MNWKKYYENIHYDKKTMDMLKEKQLPKNNLQLPKQIVEIYKKNFEIKTAKQDEALTKLLAYGRVFVVHLGNEPVIIDEFTNKIIFRKSESGIFFLSFILNKTKKQNGKVVAYKEEHSFEKSGSKIIHKVINEDNLEQEIVNKMPKEFMLSISGKTGVPCYYQGIELISEINILYQKMMRYFENEDYVFLQVTQDILKESQILNIQIKSLYYILGISPLEIENEIIDSVPRYKPGMQISIFNVINNLLKEI